MEWSKLGVGGRQRGQTGSRARSLRTVGSQKEAFFSRGGARCKMAVDAVWRMLGMRQQDWEARYCDSFHRWFSGQHCSSLCR